MQHLISVTFFSFMISLLIQLPVLAAQFNVDYSAIHKVNSHVLYIDSHQVENSVENMLVTKQAISNEAEEFSFIPSISLLSEISPDDNYDSLLYSPLQNSLLPNHLSQSHQLQSSLLPTYIRANAQAGIKSQWKITSDFMVSSFLIRRAYSINWQAEHSDSAFEFENTIISENSIIGSEISMHNLFNNKLIIGVNYQLNNFLTQQTDFPRQQINTYADFEVINNLNIHLNWILSEKKALTPLLNTRKTTILTPIDINTIHSHLLLLSVSYKM
ncbi:hypothetical protein ACRWQL_16295 [Shewanella sp. HL-SH4]|uniref:hypothetical protein n=1 Tax=Shewanella sp. HL-SH4 TaxID=3436240 RepID=UPI003EB99F41